MHVRGDVCVTGGWDGMLIFWDVPNGEMMFALQGHCDCKCHIICNGQIVVIYRRLTVF